MILITKKSLSVKVVRFPLRQLGAKKASLYLIPFFRSLAFVSTPFASLTPKGASLRERASNGQCGLTGEEERMLNPPFSLPLSLCFLCRKQRAAAMKSRRNFIRGRATGGNPIWDKGVLTKSMPLQITSRTCRSSSSPNWFLPRRGYKISSKFYKPSDPFGGLTALLSLNPLPSAGLSFANEPKPKKGGKRSSKITFAFLSYPFGSRRTPAALRVSLCERSCPRSFASERSCLWSCRESEQSERSERSAARSVRYKPYGFRYTNGATSEEVTELKASKPKYLGKFFNQCFDKGRLKNFVLWFLLNYGEYRTVRLVEQLKNIGFYYASKAGISLGIDDLKIPPKKAILMYEAENQTMQTTQQYNRGEITGVERFQRLIDTWHRTSEILKQEVIDHFEATDILNPVYMMAFSGARGNISQVRQLVGMRGLMADPQGQIIDFPIRSNFREGLTVTEYIISSYGARKGIVDTALRTANAGYLTRRLVDVAQHVIISNFDCNTTRGIFLINMKEGTKTIHSLNQRLVGRILARDLFIPGKKLASRNEEITLDLAFEIANHFNKVFVRSPLTCQKPICQLCYGWSLAQGRMVSIGEAVGIVAAQSIGEPGTQLTMRTFHTGGVFSGDVSDQIKAPFNGIVEYIAPIPGTLIRTPEGKIAFLTKSEGSFLVKKIVNNETNLNKSIETKKFTVPHHTLLYIRNSQSVYEKEVIAQISSISQKTNATDEAELTIKSDIEGQFYSKFLTFREKLIGLSLNSKQRNSTQRSLASPEEKIYQAWTWAYAWVLSGKIYDFKISLAPSNYVTTLNKLNTPFLAITGDWLNNKSYMAQTQWGLGNNRNVDFYYTKRTPSTSSLQNSSFNIKAAPVENQPILGINLNNIYFKNYAYIFEVSQQVQLFNSKCLMPLTNLPDLLFFAEIPWTKSSLFMSKAVHSKQFSYIIQWFPNKYKTDCGGVVFFNRTKFVKTFFKNNTVLFNNTFSNTLKTSLEFPRQNRSLFFEFSSCLPKQDFSTPLASSLRERTPLCASLEASRTQPKDHERKGSYLHPRNSEDSNMKTVPSSEVENLNFQKNFTINRYMFLKTRSIQNLKVFLISYNVFKLLALPSVAGKEGREQPVAPLTSSFNIKKIPSFISLYLNTKTYLIQKNRQGVISYFQFTPLKSNPISEVKHSIVTPSFKVINFSHSLNETGNLPLPVFTGTPLQNSNLIKIKTLCNKGKTKVTTCKHTSPCLYTHRNSFSSVIDVTKPLRTSSWLMELEPFLAPAFRISQISNTKERRFAAAVWLSLVRKTKPLYPCRRQPPALPPLTGQARGKGLPAPLGGAGVESRGCYAQEGSELRPKGEQTIEAKDQKIFNLKGHLQEIEQKIKPVYFINSFRVVKLSAFENTHCENLSLFCKKLDFLKRQKNLNIVRVYTNIQRLKNELNTAPQLPSHTQGTSVSTLLPPSLSLPPFASFAQRTEERRAGNGQATGSETLKRATGRAAKPLTPLEVRRKNGGQALRNFIRSETNERTMSFLNLNYSINLLCFKNNTILLNKFFNFLSNIKILRLVQQNVLTISFTNFIKETAFSSNYLNQFYKKTKNINNKSKFYAFTNIQPCFYFTPASRPGIKARMNNMKSFKSLTAFKSEQTTKKTLFYGTTKNGWVVVIPSNKSVYPIEKWFNNYYKKIIYPGKSLFNSFVFNQLIFVESFVINNIFNIKNISSFYKNLLLKQTLTTSTYFADLEFNRSVSTLTTPRPAPLEKLRWIHNKKCRFSLRQSYYNTEKSEGFLSRLSVDEVKPREEEANGRFDEVKTTKLQGERSKQSEKEGSFQEIQSNERARFERATYGAGNQGLYTLAYILQPIKEFDEMSNFCLKKYALDFIGSRFYSVALQERRFPFATRWLAPHAPPLPLSRSEPKRGGQATGSEGPGAIQKDREGSQELRPSGYCLRQPRPEGVASGSGAVSFRPLTPIGGCLRQGANPKKRTAERPVTSNVFRSRFKSKYVQNFVQILKLAKEKSFNDKPKLTFFSNNNENINTNNFAFSQTAPGASFAQRTEERRAGKGEFGYYLRGSRQNNGNSCQTKLTNCETWNRYILASAIFYGSNLQQRLIGSAYLSRNVKQEKYNQTNNNGHYISEFSPRDGLYIIEPIVQKQKIDTKCATQIAKKLNKSAYTIKRKVQKIKYRKVFINKSFDSLFTLQQFKNQNSLFIKSMQRKVLISDTSLKSVVSQQTESSQRNFFFLYLRSTDLYTSLYLHSTLYFISLNSNKDKNFDLLNSLLVFILYSTYIPSLKSIFLANKKLHKIFVFSPNYSYLDSKLFLLQSFTNPDRNSFFTVTQQSPSRNQPTRREPYRAFFASLFTSNPLPPMGVASGASGRARTTRSEKDPYGREHRESKTIESSCTSVRGVTKELRVGFSAKGISKLTTGSFSEHMFTNIKKVYFILKPTLRNFDISIHFANEEKILKKASQFRFIDFIRNNNVSNLLLTNVQRILNNTELIQTQKQVDPLHFSENTYNQSSFISFVSRKQLNLSPFLLRYNNVRNGLDNKNSQLAPLPDSVNEIKSSFAKNKYKFNFNFAYSPVSNFDNILYFKSLTGANNSLRNTNNVIPILDFYINYLNNKKYNLQKDTAWRSQSESQTPLLTVNLPQVPLSVLKSLRSKEGVLTITNFGKNSNKLTAESKIKTTYGNLINSKNLFNYSLLFDNLFESPRFSFNLINLLEVDLYKTTKTQKTRFLYAPLSLWGRSRPLQGSPHNPFRGLAPAGLSSRGTKTHYELIKAKTNYYSPFRGEIVFFPFFASSRSERALASKSRTLGLNEICSLTVKPEELLKSRDEGNIVNPSFKGVVHNGFTKPNAVNHSCMFLTNNDLISYYLPIQPDGYTSIKQNNFKRYFVENNIKVNSINKYQPYYQINNTLIKISLSSMKKEINRFKLPFPTVAHHERPNNQIHSSPVTVSSFAPRTLKSQEFIQISKMPAGKPFVTGSPFRMNRPSRASIIQKLLNKQLLVSNHKINFDLYLKGIKNQEQSLLNLVAKTVPLLGDFYAPGDPVLSFYNGVFRKNLIISESRKEKIVHASLERQNPNTMDLVAQKAGQIIHYNNSKVTIRRAQSVFISPKGVLHKFDGDFIDPKSPIITLSYQQLKTGDIIQGIPKVEQFFEARTTKRGRLFRDSLPSLLKALFKRYQNKLPLEAAVRQSFYKIQQIIVDGVQRVYKSQGVTISDKHLEVIVKQMTSKVIIIDGAQTGFFPGEIVDLDFIEKVNQFLINKVLYEPLVLGITKASLEVDSFLSASSFQQTTRVLSQAAIYRKKDFLKGLKENVILGNLIPAGTGYLVQIDSL